MPPKSEIPAGLKLILDKALEKDRRLRYQSASDLRADLQRLTRDSIDSNRETASTALFSAGNPEPW